MTRQEQFKRATFSQRHTRKELLDPRSAYGINALRRGHLQLVAALDAIAPGWKSVAVYSIFVAETADPPYWGCDNIYELPGRIFVRGWDTSGAINK